MRYSLFVYLHNMIASFQEATEYIANHASSATTSQLVTDCINGFEAVEQVLQKDKESIRDPKILQYLNQCKRLCCNLVNSAEEEANEEWKAQLACTANALAETFSNGISVKYRVVFFAELGQKWDSMSSVYDAFYKRADCEVSVVITPIFREVTVNGIKQKKVIYEDYLTPMGIPNIPYEFYDLSKERPDIAFISNPYESVTLKQFWPENIAKYTRLVYLPYYTERCVSQDSIRAHCLMPVAVHAWRIVAQSQALKRMHQKYAPLHGKNVIVTGLPKWDNINKLKQRPQSLPKDWQEKLSGKKVFLWNNHFSIPPTGFGTLLDYGQAIIDIFLKRKDIALVWRPHPMTATIFQLYVPSAQPFWAQLLQTVINSHNMVLDTNLSYVPAFQISDALLSDFSSIMAQFMLTEKPVLWLKSKQNPHGQGYISDVVHINCFEQATKPKDIERFIDNIVNGIDPKRKQRIRCLQEDLPFADGHIGERVCEQLLNDLRCERHLN